MLTNVFHRAVSVVAHKYLQQALLRTGPLFFLIFCMKLGVRKDSSDRARYCLTKNPVCLNWGKMAPKWCFLCFDGSLVH